MPPKNIQELLQKTLSKSTDGGKTYDQLSEDMKTNLGAVLGFFLDKELVHKYLLKFADAFDEFKPATGKRTFYNFFSKWGSEHGFNKGDSRDPKFQELPLSYKHSGETFKLSKFQLPKEIPYLVGILPSSLFIRVFLRLGYLISDPGAGVAHGKWTHSLQIFMLVEALKNKDIELKNCDSIVSLMKEISRYEHGGSGIFAQIFDSQTSTDYTRPEELMKAILDENLIQGESMDKLRKKFIAHNKKVDGKNTAYEQKYANKATHYYGLEVEKQKSVGFFWGKSKGAEEQLIEPEVKKETRLEMYLRLSNNTSKI